MAMSFRKLFNGVTFWGISKRRGSDASCLSDSQIGQLSNADDLTASSALSDAWLPREDSYRHFRMTPGPEMVLKQGFLYKKRERSSAASLRRPWQNGYFVLKKCPSYSGLLLDEYRDASLRVAKQTLFLDTVKHVGPVNTSRSKQYAFQVVVLGRSPLFFACDNELLRSEWIGIFSRYTDEISEQAFAHGRISPEGGPSGTSRQARLPQAGGMYLDMKSDEATDRASVSDSKGYEVVIQKTPLSEDNGLQGSYRLRVSKTRIFLRQIDGKEYVLSWPLTQLRGFKSQPEQQQVVLETGRRCHFGKGRLSLRTRHAESIIHDIREAISTDILSSENSSDSDVEINHPTVSRCRSEQQCNVTVSVHPRRIHSERVINQVAECRALNGINVGNPVGKAVGKVAPLSPFQNNSLRNSMTSSLGTPTSAAIEGSAEDPFIFEEKQASSQDALSCGGTLKKATNWKVSSTFGKTMIESRSDNENSSIDFEDETNGHSYVDIIHDEDVEKPLNSDEASTLLAQVVADLTEPQKRNCFVKSKSTGGIQGKSIDSHEIRRASAPVVGSREYGTTSESEIETQVNPFNTQWKLRLEKINEVSFTDATDVEQHASPKNSIKDENVTKTDEKERPRSLSEMLINELEAPTQPKNGKRRSKTLLGITKSTVGSSLTDLSSQKHKGLKTALSLSPSSKVSHQLERDMCFFNFAGGSGKVPSFPKSSVIKAVENAGVIDNSRSIMSMSPLPPEFHGTDPNELSNGERDDPNLSSSTPFHNNVPPRPPKGSELKTRNGKTTNRFPTSPVPERSSPQPVISPRDRHSSLKNGVFMEPPSIRPYANTPPKVHPRMPNTMPLQPSPFDGSPENTPPPPRPPKPESLSAALKSLPKQFSNSPSIGKRRVATERRAEYPWEMDRHMGSDAFKDGSPTVERVKSPLVTVTPPRSPTLQRSQKGLMRGISLSESDIRETLKKESQSRKCANSFRSTPDS